MNLHAIEPTRPRGQRRVDGLETPRHRADAATETTAWGARNSISTQAPAAVDGRRVHREAVEARAHAPGAAERRALRARRRPGAAVARPVVVVVVALAHVAGRGARRAPAPGALGAAALAEGLAGAPREAPRRARLARRAARLGLAPAGLAREADARAGGADLARVAGVALDVQRAGRRQLGGAARLAGLAALLPGRGLVAAVRALGARRRAVGVAVRARRARQARRARSGAYEPAGHVAQ